jgi:hypothetical protein
MFGLVAANHGGGFSELQIGNEGWGVFKSGLYRSEEQMVKCDTWSGYNIGDKAKSFSGNA